MGIGIILYQSKYGAARKYAGWLKEATGFEAVFGYLYLKGELNRAIDLMKIGMEPESEEN